MPVQHQRISGTQIVESRPRNALGKVVKGELEKLITRSEAR